MSIMAWILGNRRLVLTAALLLSATGAMLWMTMVRQEDPRLPDFWGAGGGALSGCGCADRGATGA